MRDVTEELTPAVFAVFEGATAGADAIKQVLSAAVVAASA